MDLQRKRLNEDLQFRKRSKAEKKTEGKR